MNKNSCLYLVQFFEHGLKVLGSKVMTVKVCEETETVRTLCMRYVNLLQGGMDIWEGQAGPESKL